MTALSEANYILHTIAFIIFHVISLEQAMKVWCGYVLLEKKKYWENYTILNQRNQNNQDLNIVFPVTGMEGDLNADTGTSDWKHLCLHA